MQIKTQNNLTTNLPELKSFINPNKKTMVFGSVWVADLEVLANFINNNQNWQYIIVPHEVDEAHLKQIEDFLKIDFCRLSQYKALKNNNLNCLIVDSVGKLATLYACCQVAYVGGGFGVGIHNVLEPAVFGVPVLFGANNTKFIEAQDLKQNACGFEITNAKEFETAMLNFENDLFLQTIKNKLHTFFETQTGATDCIFKLM